LLFYLVLLYLGLKPRLSHSVTGSQELLRTVPPSQVRGTTDCSCEISHREYVLLCNNLNHVQEKKTSTIQKTIFPFFDPASSDLNFSNVQKYVYNLHYTYTLAIKTHHLRTLSRSRLHQRGDLNRLGQDDLSQRPLDKGVTSLEGVDLGQVSLASFPGLRRDCSRRQKNLCTILRGGTRRCTQD